MMSQVIQGKGWCLSICGIYNNDILSKGNQIVPQFDHIQYVDYIGLFCHDPFLMLSLIPLIATLATSDITSPIPLGSIRPSQL